MSTIDQNNDLLFHGGQQVPIYIHILYQCIEALAIHASFRAGINTYGMYKHTHNFFMFMLCMNLSDFQTRNF